MISVINLDAFQSAPTFRREKCTNIHDSMSFFSVINLIQNSILGGGGGGGGGDYWNHDGVHVQ